MALYVFPHFHLKKTKQKQKKSSLSLDPQVISQVILYNTETIQNPIQHISLYHQHTAFSLLSEIAMKKHYTTLAAIKSPGIK